MTESFAWAARITYRADDINEVHERVDQLDHYHPENLPGPLEIDSDLDSPPAGLVTIPARGRLDVTGVPAPVIAEATVAAIAETRRIADVLGLGGDPFSVDVRKDTSPSVVD